MGKQKEGVRHLLFERVPILPENGELENGLK